MRPAFDKLWTAFPDHDRYKNLRDLYTWLGGAAQQNINEPGFGADGNTRASRMSVAFNKGGAPISAALAKAVGAKTIGAADCSRIIFQVAAFRRYPLEVLGKPTVDNTSPYDDAFRGKRGIIAFSVNWGNATGHIALWNGAMFREPGHDDYATYVHPVRPSIRTSKGEFWELH